MNVGFPTHGFYADNRGEFSNIKLDELTSKLGLIVKFGSAYSPWSNGLNERNHASADQTIKKLLEEKKTALNESLVKAATWTHNTSVNKLGYTPLQLVTGKAVTLPGLTTGNIATESLTPEVKEAKITEVNNLLDYDVFEEVKDKGQETIGSRWVVTEKEKHDSQKQQTKARLVARGFQET